MLVNDKFYLKLTKYGNLIIKYFTNWPELVPVAMRISHSWRLSCSHSCWPICECHLGISNQLPSRYMGSGDSSQMTFNEWCGWLSFSFHKKNQSSRKQSGAQLATEKKVITTIMIRPAARRPRVLNLRSPIYDHSVWGTWWAHSVARPCTRISSLLTHMVYLKPFGCNYFEGRLFDPFQFGG